MKFAAALTLTFLCFAAPHQAFSEEQKPNFLIIFIDDLGYGDLGCYGGYAKAKTPRIDQLAEEGTRYTSFYAQSVCGPSRGALMTGRYPHRIGGGWTTNADELTIAEVLQTAGYTTGCVGKWDMSKRRYQEDLVPNAQGFDHYFGALGANDRNRVTLYQDREKLETTEDMAGLTRLFTDKSIEFLEEHRDEPFFLYLAHTMMHVVIDATEEYRDRSGEGLYADTLEELDAETGRLLDALDELGLSENTVVLFTSDNGPWSNDHARQHAKNANFVAWTEGPELAWGDAGPLRGAKGTSWEGGVRVPALVRWPGKIPAGRESDAIFSTLDILPTFSALAGASEAMPTDRIIDGVDQHDLLLGSSDEGNRNQFLYFENDELQAIRQGAWKLRLPNLEKFRDWTELDRGSGEVELYHLPTDIGESRNVAAKWPKIVERLTGLAEAAKPQPPVAAIGLVEIDGRHWLTGSDGKPFWAHGITHVNNRSANLDYDAFAAACKAVGFNAYGYGCPDALRDDMPYIESWSHLIPSAYYRGEGAVTFVDIFDPAEQAKLEAGVKYSASKSRNNPNCIGYCWTDLGSWPLENPSGTNWVEFTRNLPDEAPGKKVWEEFANNWDGDDDDSRDLEFLRLIAREYFRVVGEANRRYAPDQLVFGDRFAFNTFEPVVVQEMLPYVDAIAIQPPFHGEEFPEARYEEIYALTGKPIILCDFAVRFRDGEKDIRSWRPAADSAEGGQQYAAYIRAALETDYIIGSFWCNPVDTPRGFGQGGVKQGFFGEGLSMRPGLAEAVREVNAYRDELVPRR
ncbi:MAG: sulfatase [Verrucomicrobiota bacterium]